MHIVSNNLNELSLDVKRFGKCIPGDGKESFTPERPARRRRRRRSSSSEEEEIPAKAKRVAGGGLTADDLMKIVAALQDGPSKNLNTNNVVPEFDPNNRSQDVERWLRKVNECAAIYNWDEKQTIHYSLQKLCGLAKKWYESLPTLNFSWQEWQYKMRKAFPTEENYGKLLEEMLSRRSCNDETLRDYFYDKLSLLSRCDIGGRKAVDCIIFGITDISVRNGAQALKCSEPEDLLNYLASQQLSQTKDSSRTSTSNNSSFKKRDFRGTGNSQNRNSSNRGSDLTCFNCQERGHSYSNCTKPIVKCVKCGRVGHNYDDCNRKPLISHYNGTKNEQSTDKNVLKIMSSVEANFIKETLHKKPEVTVDNNEDFLNTKTLLSANDSTVSHSKYYKTICVNDSMFDAFIDFGSDCSLIKYSVARFLTLNERVDNLPTIRGFGNSIVQPKFQTSVRVRVDEVETELNVLAVDDSFLPAALLIGQNFTELPSVTVMKDNERLFFYHSPSEKFRDETLVNLFVEGDTTIIKGGLLGVYCKESFSGDVYFGGSSRMRPNQEYHLHQGCFKVRDKRAVMFVTSLTTIPLIFKADTLIARVTPVQETKTMIINSNVCEQMVPIDLTDIKVGPSVDKTILTRLHNLITQFRSCFAQNLSELGCSKVTEMNIELNDKAPVVYRPYRLSHPERQKVREIVDELIKNDIIQESESSYASPILIVKKKNGESRLCVDYRALNNKTIKDRYPLPLIDDQISGLSGNKYFITLDLASGYYQIPMGKESRHLTAFVTPDGHYEFKRMPFGLANAPAVFQKMINKLLGQRRFDSALAYMDDLLIPSTTIDDGFQKLKDVLELIHDAGLTLKLSKCRFFDETIEYLGYDVSAEGIKPSERKIDAVKRFPVPTNVHELRQFLGLASYFRRFVKGFGEIARPLTQLLKKEVSWQWTPDQLNSFTELKSRLIERPLLALYNPNLETELHTDASSLGLGGILLQWQSSPRVLKPVAYFSRQTTPEEKYLHSYELETLAVVCSLKKFRPYLFGLKFTVYTDCNALRTTLTKRDLIPRIARWWLQISDFDFSIEYRPGCRMNHVDALSRNPSSSKNLSNFVNTLNITTNNWIVSLQIADPELQRIIRILKPGMDEESSDIKKHYTIKNHTLFRKVGEDLRLVIPKNARWQICKANHDDIGHFGFAKTLERIQQQYWFPKLRRFVKKYVAACIDCAYNKDNAGRERTGFLHPIEKVEQPFHTLHLDHLGPFVRSKSGNSYILTIVDAFTKYLFARSVKDTKTKNVIKILDNLFNDFGIPTRIISDRGTAFTSGSFKEFCSSRGIKHVLNAVACPRANGQAERFNQTILRSLATQNSSKDERIWDQQLGRVQWGINNTVNATTKRSASELLFGVKLKGPIENMLLVDAITDTENRQDPLNNSRSSTSANIDEIRHEATININESQKRQKQLYDSKRVPAKSYMVGDLVKITKVSYNNDGKSKKLMPKFIGPFKVIKCLGNDRFEIVNIPGFNTKRYDSIVAADRMRPWIHFQALSLNKSSGSESSSSESDLDANSEK